MSYSNPIDLHRVALEHPETKFVVPHFGAGYFREALMLASLAPNVYIDTSSSNQWTKYLWPQPTLREVARAGVGCHRTEPLAVRIGLVVLPERLEPDGVRDAVRGAGRAGGDGGDG